eukprot:1158325-Pelagomonas_calceolata.AAC.14
MQGLHTEVDAAAAGRAAARAGQLTLRSPKYINFQIHARAATAQVCPKGTTWSTRDLQLDRLRSLEGNCALIPRVSPGAGGAASSTPL